MGQKILIADDSQTIQKVINITLSSEPFVLAECLDSKNLNEKIESEKPDLVLLDFNLSEDKTGYDLCKDILAIHKDAQIVYLMGTFDIIDEDLISQSGATSWIVKPFDGNKFINLCRGLLIDSTNDSNWSVESASEQSHDMTSSPNSLEDQMSDWGIEVPGVIGKESFDLSELNIPGVISSTGSDLESSEAAAKISLSEPELNLSDSNIKEESSTPKLDLEQNKLEEDNDTEQKDYYPEETDLEYPDPQEIKLTPLEDLTPLEIEQDNEHIESTTTDLSPMLEPQVEGSSADLLADIEDEIKDDDLWGVDEEEYSVDPEKAPSDFPADVMSDNSSTLAQESSNLINDVFVAKKEEASAPEQQDFNMDEFIQKLRPMIEEVVKKECQKMVSNTAWEVIPDLAENLIRKEIAAIKDSVLES